MLCSLSRRPQNVQPVPLEQDGLPQWTCQHPILEMDKNRTRQSRALGGTAITKSAEQSRAEQRKKAGNESKALGGAAAALAAGHSRTEQRMKA
eukprot:185886-Pelagomonas_calceolata.AAC.2